MLKCWAGCSFRSIQADPGPAVFVNDLSFQAHLLWRYLLLIGDKVSKEEPWYSTALVGVVVWRRPHTLPPVKGL